MMQPDQDAARWDAHVAGYEAVFETLTDQFNRAALDLLGELDGVDLVDVAAGAGGAALEAAKRGAHVTAVDGSAAMVARIAARGAGRILARQADAAALPFADRSFGAALSSFGIILLPAPALGMAELQRVLRPGGRLAIVAWTEPHRYELATRLRDAIVAECGAHPLGELPAQLRFTDPAQLAGLAAGLDSPGVHRVEATLRAESAERLAASLGFAPGMAAMLAGLGPNRDAVVRRFAATLAADQGPGMVTLGAVAHILVATRP